MWDDELYLNFNAPPLQVYFRPVMTLIYGTILALFGAQPFIFHLIPVLFHILTAVLLFYLFKRFFKENLAFFLSLVFLVHPANVEAVCFASASQEVLFTFTGILGLYLLVRSKTISIGGILLSIIFFTMSLLMKETGIVFFALAFIYLIIFHRKNISSIQLYVAFAIVMVFTYAMIRFSGGNMYVQGMGLFPIMRVSFITRLINIPAIILFYLGSFLFPFKLEIAQQWVVRTMNFREFWLPLVVDIGFISLAIYALRYYTFRVIPTKVGIQLDQLPLSAGRQVHANDKHTFLFFFLWFIIGLLPHIQLVALNMTVAERWLYFPMIGLLGMMGTIVEGRKSRPKADRPLGELVDSKKIQIGATCIVALFFIRSFVRTLDWRNGLALYSSNISQTSSFDLQNNMGVELFRIGKYTEAKKYFEKSTRLAPYWWVNWNNLGASYEREKNIPKAQESYEKSVHNGDYSLAYENLAKIYVVYGTDKKQTEAFLNKALQMFPESETLRGLRERLGSWHQPDEVGERLHPRRLEDRRQKREDIKFIKFIKL